MEATNRRLPARISRDEETGDATPRSPRENPRTHGFETKGSDRSILEFWKRRVWPAIRKRGRRDATRGGECSLEKKKLEVYFVRATYIALLFDYYTPILWTDLVSWGHHVKNSEVSSWNFERGRRTNLSYGGVRVLHRTGRRRPERQTLETDPSQNWDI